MGMFNKNVCQAQNKALFDFSQFLQWKNKRPQHQCC